MLVESSRALGVIPQFCKVLRVRAIGTNKFFSTSLSEKLAEVNQKQKSQDNPNVINNTQTTENESAFQKFRFKFPELLPRPDPRYRNPISEKLQRKDMLQRRKVILIPEFYVGSILAVTTSDKHATGKMTRFVGICIMKKDLGLDSVFLLRNVVNHQGVEVLYSLYSPVIHRIEVLKLEKRLDDILVYLRDAPQEYSTVPFDMAPVFHNEKEPVPVNTIKVPLNPRPWLQRYERQDLKGVILPELSERYTRYTEERKVIKPWEKYDLMDQYRRIIPEEEQRSIFAEICQDLKELELKQKLEKKKRVFVKPVKQKLF